MIGHPEARFSLDGSYVLQDPNTNKIKQLRNLTDASGVITKFMLMDTQPVLGDWKIKVFAHVSLSSLIYTVMLLHLYEKIF